MKSFYITIAQISESETFPLSYFPCDNLIEKKICHGLICFLSNDPVSSYTGVNAKVPPLRKHGATLSTTLRCGPSRRPSFRLDWKGWSIVTISIGIVLQIVLPSNRYYHCPRPLYHQCQHCHHLLGFIKLDQSLSSTSAKYMIYTLG